MNGEMSLKKVETYHGTRRHRVSMTVVGCMFHVFQLHKLTLRDKRPAQSLRVVTLQDIKNLPRLSNCRHISASCAVEIDQERSRLLSRTHHVNDPIKHKAEVMYLPVAHLGVLLARTEVQTWPGVLIISKNDLLSRLVLR